MTSPDLDDLIRRLTEADEALGEWAQRALAGEYERGREHGFTTAHQDLDKPYTTPDPDSHRRLQIPLRVVPQQLNEELLAALTDTHNAGYHQGYLAGLEANGVPWNPEPAPENTHIDRLGIPTYGRNSLMREGIYTIADLLIRDRDELLEVRNFGVTSFYNLVVGLAAHGHHLPPVKEDNIL